MDIEAAAKELHRARCYSCGIRDEAKIAEYWLGCDREMYREKAREIERANAGGDDD